MVTDYVYVWLFAVVYDDCDWLSLRSAHFSTYAAVHIPTGRGGQVFSPKLASDEEQQNIVDRQAWCDRQVWWYILITDRDDR